MNLSTFSLAMLAWAAEVCSVGILNGTTARPEDQECEFPPRMEEDFTHVRRKRLAAVSGLVCLEDYPYTVSIRANGTHICGGAIVSRQWVMSAAQCFEDVDAEEVTVRAGSVFRDYGGMLMSADVIEAHPGYRRRIPEHNLALVKLNVPLVFGARIQVVRLPVKNVDIPTRTGEIVVTGYGSVTGTLRTGVEQELRRLMVRGMPKGQCRAQHGSGYRLQFDHACLQSVEPSQGLCDGDVGDAAVYFSGFERAGTLHSVAVYTGGAGCPPPAPAVFAEVAYSRDWVELVLSGNISDSEEEEENEVGSSSESEEEEGEIP